MITRHRNQAIFGIVACFIVFVACLVVTHWTDPAPDETSEATSSLPFFIGWGTVLGCMGSLLWSCYHLAKGKGYPTALICFGLFPCFLPLVLTALLAVQDKNPPGGAKRKPTSPNRPPESAIGRLVRYRRNALLGNVFGVFFVLTGIATMYLPIGLFEDFETEALFGFVIFIGGYIGVLWGCRWWLKAKGLQEALIFIGLLPLTLCFIPVVWQVFLVEPDFLPLSMFFMTLTLLVVVATLPNRSGRTERHRPTPPRWPDPLPAPVVNQSPPPPPNPVLPLSPAHGTQIEIRPASEEHLPDLAKLAGVIWREHYPGIISREQIEYMLKKMYALETLRAELHQQGIQFWRLLSGDRCVGFAALGPTPDPAVMKLHKCYLLPALHGRGHGSRLLQHCEHEARKLGAQRLVLAVNKHNTKAIAAYQRNGFSVAESVITDFGSGFVMDDYIMAKVLKPAVT